MANSCAETYSSKNYVLDVCQLQTPVNYKRCDEIIVIYTWLLTVEQHMADLSVTINTVISLILTR